MEENIRRRMRKAAWAFLLIELLVLPCVYAAGQGDSLSLLFVGDLMQHDAQLDAARQPDGTFDYAPCFAEVDAEIRKADIAIGNLEVPLGGRPYSGYPAFSAPDEWLYAMRDAGFDVLLAANNHCLDRGTRGLVRTVEMFDSLGMDYAGIYRDSLERVKRYPLLVGKKGFRIAFLNYTYGTNGIPVDYPAIVNRIDREQIRKDILSARQMKPDAIIACMHWGIEYELLPEASDRELAEWMLSLGVDHVIGSHPHVVQPVEIVDTLPDKVPHVIVYSLGNFISNMSRVHTDGGMMVKLLLKKSPGRAQLAGCGYSFVWTSRPALSGKRNFTVYPSDVRPEKLNGVEKSRMDLFLGNVRKLFKQYTKGIYEYFLERK